MTNVNWPGVKMMLMMVLMMKAMTVIVIDDDNDNTRYVMGLSEAAVRGTAGICVLGMSDVSLQRANSVSGTSGYGRGL